MNIVRKPCNLCHRVFSNSITSWTSSSGHRYLSSWLGAHLPQRQVIEVTGPEGAEFFQGLITNDVRHLEDKTGHGNCLFTFILTPNGRVLSDGMLYRNDRDKSLLLECDSRVTPEVMKHLTVHKLRKKLSISLLEKSRVYAIFPPTASPADTKVKATESQGQFISGGGGAAAENINDDGVILSNDTRLPISLFRVLSPSGNEVNLSHLISHGLSEESSVSVVSDSDYQSFCHRLGLSEGFNDHPPGCLPLESNGDVTHGISFFKGCYVGQELTARTYHTGVVRKRLMPLTLLNSDLSVDFEFKSKDGKTRLGKVRSLSSNSPSGLGLLYVDNVVKNNYELYSRDGKKVATTEIPFWWPQKLRSESTL